MGYNGRAWVYHLMGQDAKALVNANLAVTLPGTSFYQAASFETRGKIPGRLGARDKAAADYRAALQLNARNDNAREGLRRLGQTP